MSSSVWDQFVERLASDERKLDEFVRLEEDAIEVWLSENGFTVSLSELAKVAPKVKLDDESLDDISGGKIVIHGIRGSLLEKGKGSARSYSKMPRI